MTFQQKFLRFESDDEQFTHIWWWSYVCVCICERCEVINTVDSILCMANISSISSYIQRINVEAISSLLYSIIALLAYKLEFHFTPHVCVCVCDAKIYDAKQSEKFISN
jgi:hypothetical protein